MKKKISVNPVFRAGDFIISHDKKRIGRIKFVTVTIDSKGGQKFDFSAVFPEKGEGWETLERWPEEGGVVNIDTEDWTLFDTRSEGLDEAAAQQAAIHKFVSESKISRFRCENELDPYLA